MPRQFLIMCSFINGEPIMPAGVITLHHPTEAMIEKICQYISCLTPCYVIDNSNIKNNDIIKKLISMHNVIYIDNHGNKGVAYALNQAVNLCEEICVKWLLLMDQDSFISSANIEEMYQFAISYPQKDLGIVAASYKNFLKAEKIEEPLEVITSGSLINVQICKKMGGFLNDLFIDEVDNEFCLRLKINNYRIFKLNYISFEHTLGNKKFNKKIITYNYPPIRYYYIIRNTLYVANKYKAYFPELYCHKHNCVKKWIKMIFYEENTLQKLICALEGIIDYKINRLGEYSWKKI